ncbi:MAG: hypothetical protein NC313_00470 [Butyrivibrio sp.]|nr:hypothetical protein [Butyrivibrio sp.]
MGYIEQNVFLFNSTIRDNVTLGETFEDGQKHKALYNSTLIGDLSSMTEGTSVLDKENADIVEKSLLANPKLTLILVSHHLTPEGKEQFTHVYDLPSETLAPAN